MSITTLILGESGTGKSSSMMNLDPAQVALIQIVKKPLPFRPQGWQVAAENQQGSLKATGQGGNIYITDLSEQICHILLKITKDIIVIDDFQYLMANEFMRRSEQKGYDKFTEIARHAWDVINTATTLPNQKRIYIMAHTQTDEFGKVKAKTIGKMLDEKITLEGLFTIVLRTQVESGQYSFRTQNNGNDTVKSPIGLFDTDTIPNDLAAIDQTICDYYQLKQE